MRPVTVVDAGINLESDDIVTVSSEVMVEWTGPNEQFDYIAIATVGSPRTLDKRGTNKGNPLGVKMPEVPGEYELRYVSNKFNTVLATRLISVNDVQVKLNAPEQAGVGESIDIEWAKPGEYEVRYVLNQGNVVLATRPITVKKVLATLEAPPEAGIGESITVEWDGPDETSDRIEVGKVGLTKRYDVSYTRNGSPLKIQMPTEPGKYEVRYVLSQGNTVLARHPITVNRTAVTLAAPKEAAAGELISVEWDGPDETSDRIEIGEIGEIKRYDLSYTRDGSPAEIEMPSRPGVYELRYILDKGSTTLATRRITVTEAMVTLSAPEEAGAGESVAVNWVGPDQHADTIAIARVGERKSINSTYTKRGNPVNVQMPTEPGEYELRYVLRQGRTTLVTRPITVTEANVSLDGPNEAHQPCTYKKRQPA